MGKMAAVLANAIEIPRFFVAQDRAGIIGVVACTDCTGRAMKVEKDDFTEYLGTLRGAVAARMLAGQLTSRLDYPVTTGYIEFVAVAERARRRGIATQLVTNVIEQTRYRDYMLDVTDVNTSAQQCYTRIGFAEVKRIPEKFAKIKGFSETITMRYAK
jgi:ribosomal protein S18 acetylase RimI-like enzyme